MAHLSLNALKAAISTLDPQVLELSDGYYDARFAVSHEATDSNIALVAKELPHVLTAQVGGQTHEFCVRFHKEGGFRWIILSRQALPGTREPGRWSFDDLLDRKVFALVEQLVTPRYQGAVYGKMEAYKAPNGRIVVSLVRRCGRWRLSLLEIENNLGHIVEYPSTEPDSTLRFLIDGDTPNERIPEVMSEVAAFLELYFPPCIYLEDSTRRLQRHLLTGPSDRGDYRFWIDREENAVPA